MLQKRILVLFVYILAFFTNEIKAELPYLVYSAEQMLQHKKQCREKMQSSNQRDESYQLNRALLTVSGDDADYIPKVAGAGEIFFDGILHYQLMHNGIKILLNSYYDVQWITDVIYALKGHHEPQEEKCFFEILKYIPDNATMIELGSYWAYYSLWFASQIPGAANYMIEPDPQRLEIGKKNFQLNNKTGFFFRGYAGNILDRDPDIRDAECIAIDKFIEREGIQHVHILHADIQGSEVTMLETTVKYLDKIDYFFISTHDVKTHHVPCVEFFKKHGLIILAEHTAAQSCSGDGLLVAKRKGAPGPDHFPIRLY